MHEPNESLEQAYALEDYGWWELYRHICFSEKEKFMVKGYEPE